VQTIEVLLCSNGISAGCEIKNPTVFWQRVSLIDQGFFSAVAKSQNQPIWDIGDRGEEEQEQRDMDLRLGNWDVAESDVPDP
jgi:hypothetical protein